MMRVDGRGIYNQKQQGSREKDAENRNLSDGVHDVLQVHNAFASRLASGSNVEDGSCTIRSCVGKSRSDRSSLDPISGTITQNH
jgi:hypothetical protein